MDLVSTVVLAVYISKSIPLSPSEPVRFSEDAWIDSLANPPAHPLELKLESHKLYPSGAIELNYSIPRP